MKTLTLTILFLILTGMILSKSLIAQTNIIYLNDTNDCHASQFNVDAEKLTNNNYYIISTFLTNSSRSLNIRKINENGDVLNETSFIGDYWLGSKKCINIINDTLYIASNKYDSINNIALLCLDTNLNLLWEKNCKNNTPTLYSFIYTNDNKFVFFGDSSFVLKTDINGNEEWYNTYSNNTLHNGITTLIQDSNNIFYYGGISTSDTSGNFNYNFKLGKIDENGNLLKDTIIYNYNHDNDREYYNRFADILKSGNNLIVAGSCMLHNYEESLASRLIKFDLDFNILKDTLFKEYHNCPCDSNEEFHSHIIKIRQKNNGNILILNRKKSMNYCNSCYCHDLIELNNNFNIINKVEYRTQPLNIGHKTYLQNFEIEEDGSLYLIGETENALYSTPWKYRIWFIKTDTNYCDGMGACDTTYEITYLNPDTIIETDTSNLEFIIHNNNTTMYNASLIFYHKDLCSYVYYDTIYNIPNDSIITYPISFNFLDSINLTPNVIIEDTIFVKFKVSPIDSISHYCIATTKEENFFIFVDADSSIYVSKLNDINDFVLYPNPTKGTIRIESDKTIERIEVLDINGRVVKQIQINYVEGYAVATATPRNDVQTIDLSNEAKGIYFVKLISESGVSTQKVVLE